MPVIYRATDRKNIKIEDIEFVIAPLTFAQRGQVEAGISTGDYAEIMNSTVYMFRCAIKEVRGITYSDGSEFDLKIQDGQASEESIQELLGMPYWGVIMKVLMESISNFNTASVSVDLEGNSKQEESKSKKTKAAKPKKG